MRATWPLLGSNGPYSRVPLAAFLEAEVRLGLDGVDFVPQTPHFWCSHTGHESAAPLRAALAEAGLPVRVLTPPPYRYSLTAPPGRQREATLDYYRVCIALAQQIQTMNDHHYTGYLVQEVADEHYFSDPYAADRRNLRVLERFVEDD